MASATPFMKRNADTGEMEVQKSGRTIKYRVRARLIRHPDTGELLKGGDRHPYEEQVVGKQEAEARADVLSRQERAERDEPQVDDHAAITTGLHTPITVAIQNWLPDYIANVGTTQADIAKREIAQWVLPELLKPGSVADTPAHVRPRPIETTGQLTIDHLEYLRDHRPRFDGQRRPVSNAAKNKLVGVLMAMARDWTRRGWLPKNIAAGKEGLQSLATPKRKAKIPDPDHLALVTAKLDELYAIEHENGDWTPSDIIWTLTLAALRVSEGAGFAPEELMATDRPYLNVQRSRLRDGSERCINHPEVEKRKGKTEGAWREVSADSEVRTAIRRMERFCQPVDCSCCGTVTSGRIMCWPDGTPMSYDELRERWSRACQQAGVPHIPLGQLRHFGVARAIKAGVGLYRVMEFAGHTKIETTLNEYAGLWPSDHAEVAELLDKMGKGLTGGTP